MPAHTTMQIEQANLWLPFISKTCHRNVAMSRTKIALIHTVRKDTIDSDAVCGERPLPQHNVFIRASTAAAILYLLFSSHPCNVSGTDRYRCACTLLGRMYEI